MTARHGPARSSPADSSHGTDLDSRLDPLSPHRPFHPEIVQNIIVLHCDSVQCCLLARDVTDLVSIQGGPGNGQGAVHAALSPRFGALPHCRLLSLLHPEELRWMQGSEGAPQAQVPLPAQARTWLVLLEKGPGALLLVASHVKLLLHVDLGQACGRAPALPGLSRLTLAWLQLEGAPVPLLSVDALLWRHRAGVEGARLSPERAPIG